MADHDYRVRYSFEDWNKPAPADGFRPRPGVRVSADKYGYADDLVVISFVDEPDGPGSFMVGASDGGLRPSRAILERAKEAIEHYLAHHRPDDSANAG